MRSGRINQGGNKGYSQNRYNEGDDDDGDQVDIMDSRGDETGSWRRSRRNRIQDNLGAISPTTAPTSSNSILTTPSSSRPTPMPTSSPAPATLSPTYFPTTFPSTELNNNTVSGVPTNFPTTWPTGQPVEVQGPLLPLKRTLVPPSPASPGSIQGLQVTVEMYSSDEQGWFDSNYLGTSFYISDESQTELLAYGSLEGGTYSGHCAYCLGEGSFYFRVTISRSWTARWSFCNTEGSAAEQLSFHVVNGRCVPDVLSSASSLCYQSLYSVLTLSARFTIQGATSDPFSWRDELLALRALTALGYGWDLDHMHLTDKKAAVTSGRRQLSGLTYCIYVSLSVVPELAYEVDGSSHAALLYLVSALKQSLRETFSLGYYTAAIRTLVTEESLSLSVFREATVCTLEDLEMVSVTYVGAEEMAVSAESGGYGAGGEDWSGRVRGEWVLPAVMYLAPYILAGALMLGSLGLAAYLVHRHWNLLYRERDARDRRGREERSRLRRVFDEDRFLLASTHGQLVMMGKQKELKLLVLTEKSVLI
eukprot:gene2726-3316_t